MKTKTLVTVFLAILIFSCEKSGYKPEIVFNELGLDDSKTALVGGELHMEAEIDAENKIDRIEIEIHPEGETHEKSVVTLQNTVEWEFDTVYSEFSGLRNTHFHKHIEIPEDAEPGHYHFHFLVTDMEGYQAEFEDELEILASEEE